MNKLLINACYAAVAGFLGLTGYLYPDHPIWSLISMVVFVFLMCCIFDIKEQQAKDRDDN